MCSRAIACVLAVSMMTSMGCHDDPPSVAGPDAQPTSISPKNVLPPNGGLLPEVISTTVGEAKIDSFSFENDAANGNREVEGSPWGVWFGDQHILSEDPPTGNKSWTFSTTLGHSGTRAIDDFNVPRQAFLYFDPPVRAVSFWYASKAGDGDGMGGTSFYYRISDTLGVTVSFDSIYANYVPPDVQWTRVSASTGDEDRIYRVYFDGLMVIDDLVIARAAQPGIVCTQVQRGEETTCSIVVPVEEVESWKFEADTASVAGPPFIFSDSLNHDTTWVGKAVVSGVVSAEVVIDSVEQILTGVLEVLPREPSKYERFSAEDDVSYDSLAARCFLLPYYAIPNVLAGGANDNTPVERCEDHILDPAPVGETVDSGYVHAAVADSGPNHGLFYVEAGLWKIHRGSWVNWSLDEDENTTRQSLDDNKQHKKCDRADPRPAIPGLANTWEYNVLCEGNNFESFLAAIRAHEGMGTLGTGVSQPNGHQARIEKYAASASGDPYLHVEAIVAADTAQLNLFVGGEAASAGEEILSFSNQHDLMQPVWCNENLFLYDTVSNVYQKVLYTTDPNGPGNVVLIECR